MFLFFTISSLSCSLFLFVVSLFYLISFCRYFVFFSLIFILSFLSFFPYFPLPFCLCSLISSLPFLVHIKTPNFTPMTPKFPPNRSDYRGSSDLHIGVTDSEGRVHEYDREGLQSDCTASWSQCLAVPILSSGVCESPDPVWKEYWDFTLHSISTENWSETRWQLSLYRVEIFFIRVAFRCLYRFVRVGLSWRIGYYFVQPDLICNKFSAYRFNA